MEMMVALFVGYFLYESDASNWWWTGYWTIIGVGAVERMFNTYSLIKYKHGKENGNKSKSIK